MNTYNSTLWWCCSATVGKKYDDNDNAVFSSLSLQALIHPFYTCHDASINIIYIIINKLSGYWRQSDWSAGTPGAWTHRQREQRN